FLGGIILDTVRSFSVYNGDTLVLWCTDRDLRSLQGNVNLSWVKDDVTIPDVDPRLNTIANGTLLLAHVRQKDAGTYTCTVQADGFLSTNTTRLSVIGEDPPSSTTTSGLSMMSVTSSHGNTVTPISATSSSITLNSVTSMSVTPSSVTTSSVTLRSVTLNSNQTRTISYTPEAAPTPTNIPSPNSNRISGLQRQVVALLNGDHSTNVSAVIKELANLTKPGNDLKLNADELSTSLNVLVQLVAHNSEENNNFINTSVDQQNIVEVASNLLEDENSNTWLLVQETRENITDDLLKTMDDFGSQVSSQLDGSDNSSTLVIQSKNIGFRVDRLNSRQMLNIDLSHYGAALFVPDLVFSDSSSSRVSTIVYRTLHKVFRLQSEGSGNDQSRGLRTSGSNIISATILPRPKSPLEKPVKLVFNQTIKSDDLTEECVFWEIGLSQRTWLTRGCVRVEDESNARMTTCECDHLTIFAVLMNNKPVEARHQPYLKYISTAGCACSLLFLLLTFVLILLCWKQVKSVRVTMLLHLCLAIAASSVLIIIADYAQKHKVFCTVTAALLHYFLLCVFSWMLCHGVIFYFLIIKVELKEKLKPKMKFLYALGWGFPLPIVAVSLVVTRTQTYAADNCWLTLEHGIIYWAFVAPVAIIVFINTVLFIFLLRRINRVTKFKENMTRVKHVKAWLRRSAMLLPVLGVTWSFGLLTFISSTVVFHYVFTILNSLQGFFIFINFCILDDTVKGAIVSTLCMRNSTSPNEQAQLTNRHDADRRQTTPQTQT
ncbi:adhesion G-protein coupled receptor D1-like, partial [Oculina patagonica]